MKTLLKLIMIGCTLLCGFVFLEVLFEDDESTTTEQVEVRHDNVRRNDDVKPQATKKITAINNSSFRNKVANYSASTTSCGKNVKAVVLLYSDKYEISIKMLNEMKSIINDYDYNFYSLKLEDGLEVVKAYELTDVPTLIVASDGEIFIKKGYISSANLGSVLNR